MLEPPSSRTTGWRPTCHCPDAGPPVAQRILDPFVGSGTSLVVAQSLGLDGTGIDLQPTYVDIAKRRLVDGYSVVEQQDGELRVMQRDLFSLVDGDD